ncbi:MAG TPA: hypothetical protein VGJ13_14090 [Pseudonocardiaceae bacterium]
MSRSPYRRSRRHHHPVRGLPGPLLVLGAVLLAGGMAAVVTLVTALITIGPLLLVGAAVVAVVSARRRHQRPVTRGQRRPVPVTRPVAPVGRAAPVPDWAGARARFDRLRSAYGQFECDPLAVLRLPALTDVTVPSTGRFVAAFAEAQALDTDAEPPSAHRDRYIAAVDAAWRCWQAALDAAQRIRLAGIPAEEHATVHRAIKLLTVARDCDNPAERIAAYTKARAKLAKLERSGTLRLPPAAAAAVDTAARAELPAPPPRTGTTPTGTTRTDAARAPAAERGAP